MRPPGGEAAGWTPEDQQADRDRFYDEEVSELYRQHATKLECYLTAMQGDRPTADVQDVLHDSFLVVRSKWEQLRTGSPKAYLYKVATTRMRDLRKRRAKEALRTELPDREALESIETRVTGIAAAMELVRQLPRRHMEAVILRVMCDLSEAETAEALQVGVGSVKNYLSLGLKQLRSLTTDDTTYQEVRR